MKFTTVAPPRRKFGRFTQHMRIRIDRMSDTTMFGFVAGLSCLAAFWSLLAPDHVRVLAVAVISLVSASLLLNAWSVLALILLLAVWAAVIAHVSPQNQFSTSGVVMAGVVAVVALVQARRRDALGLHRRSAESVLEEMRYRVSTQAEFPRLSDGWRAEVVNRANRGAPFAGDFVSARLCTAEDGGAVLELAAVDVSGSGMRAGARALLLSGAVGGLLGAVPAQQFLPRVNDYVRRQGWKSAFATASYLRVDLEKATFELRSAGHPPALHFAAARGTSALCESSGVVLGVVDSLDVVPASGHLATGDVLVLFTDGVVETRKQSVEEGVRLLADQVQRWLALNSPESMADALVDSGHHDDDRTVVVLWKDGTGPDTACPAGASEGSGRRESNSRKQFGRL